MTATFTLPWPAKELFPNHRSRVHWGKTKATKAARTLAYWTTQMEVDQAGYVVPAEGEVALRVVMRPPNRRMDDDNIKAGFKAYRDGIADALGINDKRFAVTIAIGEKTPLGLVEVSL